MQSRRDIQLVPRAFAGKILTDLRIEAADEIDVEAIAAHYNCFVKYGGVHGADGRVFSDGKRAIIRVRSDIKDIARRRFIVAHELGHVRLRHTPTLDFCSEADLVRYEAGAAEAEANAFAAELLMPAKLVRPLFRKRRVGLDLAEELARGFRTTFTAAAIRIVDLADEPCAIVWSEAKQVTWSINSPASSWFVRTGSSLSRLTNAYDVFSGVRSIPAGPALVDGDAWAEGYEVPEQLIEETRSLRSFGAAFTLLRER